MSSLKIEEVMTGGSVSVLTILSPDAEIEEALQLDPAYCNSVLVGVVIDDIQRRWIVAEKEFVMAYMKEHGSRIDWPLVNRLKEGATWYEPYAFIALEAAKIAARMVIPDVDTSNVLYCMEAVRLMEP